jgi:hypothetical protein
MGIRSDCTSSISNQSFTSYRLITTEPASPACRFKPDTFSISRLSLGAGFGSICRIETGLVSSWRRRHHLAVHRLPLPLNVTFLRLIPDHHSIDLLPQTSFVPGLNRLCKLLLAPDHSLFKPFHWQPLLSINRIPFTTCRFGSAGLPGAPFRFSRGRTRSIRSHNPSGISHSVV